MSRCIDAHAVRLIEFGLFGRAADAGSPFFPVPATRTSFPRFGHVLADDVVVGIGDQDVLIAIEAEMFRSAKRGLQGRAVVSGRPCLARPGQRANLALAIDDAQRMAAAFEHVHVSCAVGSDGPRIDQRRFASDGAVGRHPARRCPRPGG